MALLEAHACTVCERMLPVNRALGCYALMAGPEGIAIACVDCYRKLYAEENMSTYRQVKLREDVVLREYKRRFGHAVGEQPSKGAEAR
jgi:hypothetical protein